MKLNKENIMKSFLPLIFCSFFILSTVFGEENANPEKNTNEDQEQSENNKLLTAEEFSKAFSKPQYKNQIAGEKDKKKEDLPFEVDGIGPSPFENQAFKDAETPAGSLAASIPKLHKYIWLPRWYYSGKGGVQLPEAGISSDGSILGILETVPREDAQSGSMIILINTYNWTVANIHYFKDRLFTKLFFLPRKKQLIVWEDAQKDKPLRKILAINAISGKIVAESRDINDAFSGIAIDPSGNKIYLKTMNEEKSIYVFDIDNLAEKPEKIKCLTDAGNIAVSENCLVFAAKDKLTVSKLNSNQKIFEIDNPLKEVPQRIIFLGNDEKIAFSSYMKPFIISIDRKSKELANSAGNTVFYRQDLDLLVFEEYKNRQLTFFSIPKMETISDLLPGKIKPKTAAGALYVTYLSHLDKYVVLDTQGSLFLYDKPGRKWRKEIIFSAKK